MNPLLAAALCCVLQSPDPPAELVQSIEQQRGGRHWIDQPTEPPRTAAESQACFELEPGFRIELVASEPLVRDPVAIDFDQRGRMYVAEYGDYPVGPADPAAPALSRIVRLDDTDGDGLPDQRRLFAEGIRFCHSVLAFQSGVLTCSDTQILYAPDDDDDGRADRVEVWFDGFIPAHPQMQIGCPRYGFDSRIWFTCGHGTVRCTRPGFETEPVEIPRVDFCFDPRTMKFEAVSGAGQFGHTIDNDGHRFFSSNRNPIMTDLFTLEQVSRNPLAGVATAHVDVGPSGEHARVYPRVDMKSNWLSHAGTHTAACGVTAYRGGQFGPASDQMVFVCEPVGHLVTRSVIKNDAQGLTAERARENADFLTSTDTWFRPVSLSTGPDGALYLADMYRLWVEHPQFVPDDVAAKMDWRAGEDRGRIWRITADVSEAKRPFKPPESMSELLSMLNDPNGWRRMLAQRLIVERRPERARDWLHPMVRADSQTTRLQVLWTLDGLQMLQDSELIEAAYSDGFAVRRDVIRLMSRRAQSAAEFAPVIERLCLDPHPEVRQQAILAVDPETASGRAALLASVPGCLQWPALQQSLLLAAGPLAADLAAAALAAAPGQPSGTSSSIESFLRQAAMSAAALGDSGQLASLLSLIVRQDTVSDAQRAALINGMAEGLSRSQIASRPRSLSELLVTPPEGRAETAAEVTRLLQAATVAATAPDSTEASRIAAIELLPHLPPGTLQAAVTQLLTAQNSSSVQRALLQAIRRSGHPSIAGRVIEHWDGLHPQARASALDLLLLRPESTRQLLQAMSAGSIPSSAISIDQRLALLQHPDAEIATAAAAMFGGAVSADRRQVIDGYRAALTLAGDATRGAEVFEKSCSKCHRIGSVGHHVGPDLSDTRARARDALLYDILDPNRRVDPQYGECVVVTADGRVFSGLLVNESHASITLRQPEGREETLLRSDIEELRTSGKSLMPEGLEKDLTVGQIADVLTFLKDR